jgi:hypothetical protein
MLEVGWLLLKRGQTETSTTICPPAAKPAQAVGPPLAPGGVRDRSRSVRFRLPKLGCGCLHARNGFDHQEMPSRFNCK